ncbi:hypothetical protein ACJJTC_004846 [Scirpophaga incertulas]
MSSESVGGQRGVQSEQQAHVAVVELRGVLRARDQRREPALAARRHRVAACSVQCGSPLPMSSESVGGQRGVQSEQQAHVAVVELRGVLRARDQRREPALAARRHRVAACSVQCGSPLPMSSESVGGQRGVQSEQQAHVAVVELRGVLRARDQRREPALAARRHRVAACSVQCGSPLPMSNESVGGQRGVQSEQQAHVAVVELRGVLRARDQRREPALAARRHRRGVQSEQQAHVAVVELRGVLRARDQRREPALAARRHRVAACSVQCGSPLPMSSESVGGQRGVQSEQQAHVAVVELRGVLRARDQRREPALAARRHRVAACSVQCGSPLPMSNESVGGQRGVQSEQQAHVAVVELRGVLRARDQRREPALAARRHRRGVQSEQQAHVAVVELRGVLRARDQRREPALAARRHRVAACSVQCGSPLPMSSESVGGQRGVQSEQQAHVAVVELRGVLRARDQRREPALAARRHRVAACSVQCGSPLPMSNESVGGQRGVQSEQQAHVAVVELRGVLRARDQRREPALAARRHRRGVQSEQQAHVAVVELRGVLRARDQRREPALAARRHRVAACSVQCGSPLPMSSESVGGQRGVQSEQQAHVAVVELRGVLRARDQRREPALAARRHRVAACSVQCGSPLPMSSESVGGQRGVQSEQQAHVAVVELRGVLRARDQRREPALAARRHRVAACSVQCGSPLPMSSESVGGQRGVQSEQQAHVAVVELRGVLRARDQRREPALAARRHRVAACSVQCGSPLPMSNESVGGQRGVQSEQQAHVAVVELRGVLRARDQRREPALAARRHRVAACSVQRAVWLTSPYVQ